MDNRFTCACGRVYRIVEEGRGEMKKGVFARLLRRHHDDKFEASYPWEPSVAQPIPMAHFTSPPRAPAERPHILARYFDLNWRTALASGFFAALCLGLLYMPSVFQGNAWYNPFVAAGIGFAITATGVWGVLTFFDRRGLGSLERPLGIDIKDGKTGEPEWVRGEVTDKDKGQITRIEFPFPNDRLRAVAQAILRGGAAFSRRGLSNVISESQFHTLQQEFLKRGLCYWKNPESEQQGVDLSPGGRAFLRMYLK